MENLEDLINLNSVTRHFGQKGNLRKKNAFKKANIHKWDELINVTLPSLLEEKKKKLGCKLVELEVGCHTCKHNPHAPFVPKICDECDLEILSKWQPID